jgi:TPR repeat protein
VIFGVAAFADAHRAWFDDRGVGFAALGALGIALPFARRHGRRLLGALRDSPSARWKAGVGAASVAMAAACALSAHVRCTLGSGASCYRAAQHAEDQGVGTLALRLAERGCALDDDRACAMAGHAYWQGVDRGLAVPALRDRSRAEGLLRSGCALGAREACRDLSLVELERGCEGYSASACHALGDAYDRGAGVRRNPSEASRFLRQACLLGDAAACGAP